MFPDAPQVQLLPQNVLALNTVADREGLTVTDVANRAIQIYAVISSIPMGKQAEYERPDGIQIVIQCPPTDR